MSKLEQIIANRIEEEHNKHPTLNWQLIAAKKIAAELRELDEKKLIELVKEQANEAV